MSAALLVALPATVGIYLLALRLDARVRRPWTNPVGLTVASLVVLVAVGVLPLDAYRRGSAPLVWALRPAVVALGWLLYRQRAELQRWALPLAGGVVAGSAVSLIVTPLLARWLDAPAELQAALALKSVTSAVGVDLAARVGADAALTVPFVIVTGILGAAFGPPLLRWALPNAAPARGLAIGTNSHGIGTAAVAQREGELPAALAGLAMAASAVVTGLLAPLAFAWLQLP